MPEPLQRPLLNPVDYLEDDCPRGVTSSQSSRVASRVSSVASQQPSVVVIAQPGRGQLPVSGERVWNSGICECFSDIDSCSYICDGK